MPLFKSKSARELDALIDEMKINLANNYKSTAHAARVKLGERCEALYMDGKLKADEYKKYRAVFEEYTELLKDYRH